MEVAAVANEEVAEAKVVVEAKPLFILVKAIASSSKLALLFLAVLFTLTTPSSTRDTRTSVWFTLSIYQLVPVR